MDRVSVIAIFDVGKTNKKLLLFDTRYQLVFEKSNPLPEITDEDGFPCEDVDGLTAWIKEAFSEILTDQQFDIKAVNFTAYGASFVYLDEQRKQILPLYNYLKPYPPVLQEKFYAEHGGEQLLARQTASPVLGSLNSGMQLYRLKHERTEIFDRIRYALHLPQYLCFILSGEVNTDLTSVGCHTNLWNFREHQYHDWVKTEGITDILPAIKNCADIAGYVNAEIPAGIGLHDSSSALIPYLASFSEPFILISTGTWCISLNPFNQSSLTDGELQQDCLCYLSYEGKPVKAARIFAGYEHEQAVKTLATRFNKPLNHYKTVSYDPAFDTINADMADSYEAAYHALIAGIVAQQLHSTNLVLKGSPVKRIFVDGGFSNNPVYMNLLAAAFPGIAVYAAVVPQASALGAALAIHQHWNSQPLPRDIVDIRLYSNPQVVL